MTFIMVQSIRYGKKLFVGHLPVFIDYKLKTQFVKTSMYYIGKLYI